MKKCIHILCVPVLFSLLFVSCKKESTNGLQVVTTDQLKKIKNYYHSQQKPGSNESISEGAPQWERTIFDAEQGKYLVPVAVSREKTTGKYIINKYLLISALNSELAGEYVFAMQNAGSNEILNGRQIENAILEDIPAADLIIARRGLQQATINKAPGKHINTRIKKQNTPYLQKNNTDTVVVANSLPMANCEANGGIIVEIEWWYQEYDQHGNVVYEEYVYSTYECWVSGGGGSGGSGGSGTNPSVVTTTNTVIEYESNYVNEDILGVSELEKSQHERFGPVYVPIKYLHRYQTSRHNNLRTIIAIIVDPVTVDSYVSSYQDSYQRQVTRRLTLLNKVQNYTLLSQYSANVNWFCTVNGRYTYSNGNPTFTRQWDHSKSIITASY